MNENNTYITEQGLTKLKQEYDNLVNIRRQEIAERIRDAKELGDLSENAEYAEAKNEQSFIEGRIQEIESILRHATVIKESNEKKDKVEVGSKIKIKDGDAVKEYYIVGSNESDPTKGKISNESPLGKAFLGKKPGDTIEIDLPTGVKKYKIQAIY